MGKKEEQIFPFLQEPGHTFDRQDDILNFKPVIEFVEPEQIPLEDEDFIEPEDTTIDDLRLQTEDLINGYKALSQLIDQTQKRIDNRVSAAGGINVKLDPNKDAAAIAAMKRQFPDLDDHTTIPYDCYKKCLKDLGSKGADVPSVLDEEIKAAKTDPLRTDFGGLGNQSGENRPEISSVANVVNPIDLSAFQAAGVIALFALMFPLIKGQDLATVAQHLITTPHSPI